MGRDIERGKKPNLQRSEKGSSRNIIYVYAGKSCSFPPSVIYCNKLGEIADKV